MDYIVSGRAPDIATAVVPHVVNGDGTVSASGQGIAWTKTAITMTGVSAALIGANANRKRLVISSASGNGAAAIDLSGGTAALTAGLALNGGDTIILTDGDCRGAVTQIGTSGQVLTVFEGT